MQFRRHGKGGVKVKTYNKEIVNSVYKLWVDTLGMEAVTLPSKVDCMPVINCYKYKDMFLRLDTFRDGDELIYCIEAADSKDLAQNNIFDDAWLYPESMGKYKILEGMQSDLQSA